MKRVARLFLLLLFLAAAVTGSFYLYLYTHRNSGAVASALLAGFTSISPYKVAYAGPDSDPLCRQAYAFVKNNTGVCFIENGDSSRYNPQENIVYLTEKALLTDSVEAVHEFGHALDRYLNGEESGYFSRGETFSQAYALDCARMQESFQAQDLFEAETYRNLAISDILFSVFYQDTAMTNTLIASYNASGVPYWRHDENYMSDLEKRQTEVFADIFVVLLSDDEQAQNFIQEFLPESKEVLHCAVSKREW